MSKHTPGPWISHQETHGLFISAGPFCIASLGDGKSVGQPENARLIAAAPDLLAALTELYAACSQRDNVPAHIRARAAIAKATHGDALASRWSDVAEGNK